MVDGWEDGRMVNGVSHFPIVNTGQSDIELEGWRGGLIAFFFS